MSIESKATNKALRQLEKITGGKLTLGKLIWSVRMCEEQTQVEFAKKLGISRQHLCDVEHDRKSISPMLAAKYAKLLGYSSEQFVRLSMQSTLDTANLPFQVRLIPVSA